MVSEKACSKCGEVKLAAMFSRCRSAKTGLQGYCKACYKLATDRLKQEVFEAYGGRCQCPYCDVTDFAFLTIDHIYGDGAASKRNGEGTGASLWWYLKRMGFPKERHRLLCYNCNCARRFGPCPHELRHIASLAQSGA